MGDRISVLPYLVVAALLLCYAGVSISPIFSDENPIRITSNGLNYIHDDADLSFTSISPSYTIEAIYQFGDSISDTGNLIRENPSSNYARLPYGQTFFHKPTGRCSNGLLMIDYFTKFFKLPFLDPYLNKEGNFSHGVNFAVAGATALNGSTLAKKHNLSGPTNSSLLVQLDWFKTHLNSTCSNASDCKKKLAKALIVMGEIGGNDYNWAFFQRKPITEIYDMVPKVIQVIKNVVKEVINLGATRIVVPGNFPIGCMTIYLDMFKTDDLKMYDEHQCLRSLNDFAKFHNDKLQEAIREIQRDHPNVSIMYADYFEALKEILQDATSLGFEKDKVLTACCGSRGIVCGDPYKHVNWDRIHLTQHAYQVMAKSLIKPINDLGMPSNSSGSKSSIPQLFLYHLCAIIFCWFLLLI